MPYLLLVIVAALVGSDPQSVPPPPSSSIDVVTALEHTLIDAIARVEPSVVAIARDKDGKSEETTAVRGRNVPPSVREPRPFFANDARNLNGAIFDSDQPDVTASDYGSGVVIGPKGEILTAFSVVKGASKLLVRAKGLGLFNAEVIASDPRSDLAVIAPCDPTTHPRPDFIPLAAADLAKLRPLPIGDATKLRKGSFLLALGNPFNSSKDGRASASWGILANVARRLDFSYQEHPNRKQLRHYPTLLQLDAKLNLGMSGGAVVNLKGELVGLTTDAANVGGFDAQAGYAMPIDALAKRAIDSLRQGREMEYGFLGIGLSQDESNKVGNVAPGTPAGEGGLMIEDAILAIGDLPVVDSDSLVLAVNSFTPGLPIKLRIRRDGKEIEKTVVLSKLPVVGEVIATNRAANWRGLRVDFVSTSLRNTRAVADLDAMARGGVVVSEVQPGSAADDAELRPGLIIISVEDQPVRSPTEFAKAVNDRRGPVTVTVEGNQRVVIK